MEIRLIFFKEIVGLISLKNGLNLSCIQHLSYWEEKSPRRFFLSKASLISILQKFSYSPTFCLVAHRIHARREVGQLWQLRIFAGKRTPAVRLRG